MSHQPEYIQLAPDEDLASIRDRLSFIRGRRVLLIWPETGTALTRKLDLVLIQREAKRRAIQLALVTHDEQVILNARDLNISTFETVKQSERGRWQRGRTKVFLPREHKPEDEAEPYELMTVASRVRSSRKRISQVRYIFERTVIICLVLALISGIAYVFVPSATITLNVNQQIITVDTTITADPDPAITDLDVNNRLIPASVLRAPVRTVSTIPTTGVQQFDDLPAVGTVVFTNNTTQQVIIPADTIVATSTGTPIQFRTLESATLSGSVGAQVTVPIEAVASSSGTQGNVGTGLINTVTGDLADSVSVVNVSPTTGGEGRVQSVVTQEDLDRLRLILNGELQRIAYEEMQQQLTETQTFILETLHIPEDGTRSDWITYTHNVGDVTDNVSLDMRAIVEAVVVDNRFARQIIFAQLSSRKPAELIIQPDTYIFTVGEITSIDDQDRITFEASGEVVATARVDHSQLINQLAGLPLDGVERVIAQQVPLLTGSQPEVTVSPAWLTHMPYMAFRINLIVENES